MANYPVEPKDRVGVYGAPDAAIQSNIAMMNHEGSEWTYLDYIDINFEDGSSSDAELLIKAFFYSETGELVNSDSWFAPEFGDFEGDLQDHDAVPHDPLIAKVIPDTSVHYIRIEVWEDDCNCFFNDDDYYGFRNFYYGDREENRSINSSGGETAVVQLAWTPIPRSQITTIDISPSNLFVDPGNSRDAFATVLDQYGYELNDGVTWTIDDSFIASLSNIQPQRVTVNKITGGSTTLRASASGVSGSVQVSTYVPPPDLEASIMGDTNIPPNEMCGWMSSVSGGTPPYTYQWTRDYSQVSTSWSYTGSANSGTFRLDLKVWDSVGHSTTDIMHVYVDESTERCAVVPVMG